MANILKAINDFRYPNATDLFVILGWVPYVVRTNMRSGIYSYVHFKFVECSKEDKVHCYGSSNDGNGGRGDRRAKIKNLERYSSCKKRRKKENPSFVVVVVGEE
jgi:hypothetical protein